MYRSSNGVSLTHTWLQISKYVGGDVLAELISPHDWQPSVSPSVLSDDSTLRPRWSNHSVVGLAPGEARPVVSQEVKISEARRRAERGFLSNYFSHRDHWAAGFPSLNLTIPEHSSPYMSNSKVKLSLILGNYGKLLGLFYDDVF